MNVRFINNSNNTICFQDIDLNIPFLEDMSEQEIPLDDLKKSNSFRLLVSLGEIIITKCGNSIFERSLIQMQENAKKKPFNKKDIEKKEEVGESILSDSISVKIKGHFYEAGGYAKANRNLAIALNDLGINVEICPVNKSDNHLTEEEIRKLTKINKTASGKVISIDSMIPTFSCMSAQGYRILYTTVEAHSVPNQFIEVANQYHEVWVTSDFCKSVLKEYGVNRPIFVIPNSVDTDLYKQSKPYSFRPELKSFVFISVFGWSYRKGYDVLLRSFLEEFSGDDQVSLLMLTRMSGYNKEDLASKEIKKYIDLYGGKNPPHISKCESIIPEKLMPNIYSSANAFVLFSRGEGFCTLPNAKIKTVDGEKNINILSVGDKVFSHRGVLRKITHKFEREYDGNMIQIKSYGRENQCLTVTPNHKIRVLRLDKITNQIKCLYNFNYDPKDDVLECSDNINSFSYKLEWVESCEVKIGDFLFYPKTSGDNGNISEKTTTLSSCDFINKDSLQLLRVKDISFVPYKGKVYNIGVEKDNSYICEKVAVHNCLPAIEASLCDLPIISTNTSGHSMFLKKDNSFLIDIDEIKPLDTGLMKVHYWDGQLFPKLKNINVINQAKSKMRYVFENYEKSKDINNKLKCFIKNNYNINNVGFMAKKRLQQIWENLK